MTVDFDASADATDAGETESAAQDENEKHHPEAEGQESDNVTVDLEASADATEIGRAHV